jgi:hypothetical protein
MVARAGESPLTRLDGWMSGAVGSFGVSMVLANRFESCPEGCKSDEGRRTMRAAPCWRRGPPSFHLPDVGDCRTMRRQVTRWRGRPQPLLTGVEFTPIRNRVEAGVTCRRAGYRGRANHPQSRPTPVPYARSLADRPELRLFTRKSGCFGMNRTANASLERQLFGALPVRHIGQMGELSMVPWQVFSLLTRWNCRFRRRCVRTVDHPTGRAWVITPGDVVPDTSSPVRKSP